jgi:3-phenylpropionate/trans-cinnamate dioxygenase ferredoxin reductase component
VTLHRYDYLIVGGGMTADAAVRGIREADPSGTIGLVSAEAHPPYNRPPLSKALWKGEPEATIWRGTEAAGAALHLGRRATALDLAGRRVSDDVGDQYAYRSLLLATGGAPRRLAGEGDVIYFRTVDDYRRLRALADRKARCAVVGGGFIGSEIAAALRMAGCQVEMLVPEAGLAARVFPAELSGHLVEYYRGQGVTMRMGEGVAGLETRAGKTVIRTSAAGELAADAIVAGLGILPGVELAERAGLKVENGIVVDRMLRTGDPNVWAAGDVANFPNAALGVRTRVEHEDAANSMGAAAGRAMAGRGAPYEHLPFFYSDLFELGYEAVGDLDARLETVVDWKEPFREGVIYYLKNGRVRGVLLWNTWGQVDHARALIAQPGPFRPADLKGRLPA